LEPTALAVLIGSSLAAKLRFAQVERLFDSTVQLLNSGVVQAMQITSTAVAFPSVMWYFYLYNCTALDGGVYEHSC